jgi:hypothetical protein
MKLPVALVLIVAGTALILAPPAADALRRADTVRLLQASPDARNVTLGGEMSSEYRLGCFAAGVAMVAVAVVGALLRRGPAPGVSEGAPSPGRADGSRPGAFRAAGDRP